MYYGIITSRGKVYSCSSLAKVDEFFSHECSEHKSSGRDFRLLVSDFQAYFNNPKPEKVISDQNLIHSTCICNEIQLDKETFIRNLQNHANIYTITIGNKYSTHTITTVRYITHLNN